MIEKSSIDYEKAVLIGLITQKQNTDKSNEYLDELEFLTYTAGGEVLKRFVQKMESPNSKTFLGSGKIEEVREYIEKHEVGLVVFDDELSPAQQRNIEFNLINRQWSNVVEPSIYGSLEVKSIVLNKENIFIATVNGLTQYDMINNSLEIFNYKFIGDINDMYIKGKKIWLGTSEGLISFQYK